MPTSLWVSSRARRTIPTDSIDSIIQATQRMAEAMTNKFGDEKLTHEWIVRLTNEGGDNGVLVGYIMHEGDTSKFRVLQEFTVHNIEGSGSPWVTAHTFAIDPGLQRKGVSKIFLRGAYDSLQGVGGHEIKLSAGLQKGGYTWLRAGFFPESQHELGRLRNFVRASDKLTDQQKRAFLSKTTQELRTFALTNEFKDYEKALSKSHWKGSLDTRDKKSVQAMLGEYVTRRGAQLSTTTANKQLFDAYTRHQIHLLRGAKGEGGAVIELLDQSEAEIAAKLRAFDNSGGILAPGMQRRLKGLQAEIAALRLDAWDKSMGKLDTDMVMLAKAEPVTIDEMQRTVSPVAINNKIPSAPLLESIVESRPFQGKVLKEWAATMESADLARIRNQVQLGMASGESMQTISRRVFGTLQAEGSDGVTNITRNQVTAVTRTAVQHVANEARREFALKNKEIAPREMYSATLDSRTTPICMSLDGDIFDVGLGPYPPIHWQCRSVRRQIFSNQVLGHRPAKQVTDQMLVRQYAREHDLEIVSNRKFLPRGHKGAFDEWARIRTRQLIGPVPGAETYETFARAQSREFLDDTLGKTKAKLFIEGKLPLKRFVHRNGDALTLAEIAARDRAAFIAAGLDPDAYIQGSIPRLPRTPVPPPATSAGDFWLKGTAQEEWHNFSFDKSPLYIKEAIKKYDDRLTNVTRIRGKRAFYSVGGKSINMSNQVVVSGESQATWRHEYGHFLDHQIDTQPFRRQASLQPRYVKAMRADAKTLRKGAGIVTGSAEKKLTDTLAFTDKTTKVLNDIKAKSVLLPDDRKRYISSLNRDIGITDDQFTTFWNREFAYELGTKDGDRRAMWALQSIKNSNADWLNKAVYSSNRQEWLSTVKKENLSKFSDLVGSATGNRVLGYKLGFGGHTDAYYKHRAGMKETETFANLTTLAGANDPVWDKILETFTPEMLTIFKDQINGR